MLLAGATPANAAGPAELSIELTAIDPATLQDITSTGFGQHNNRIAYRVAFSCSVAECTDAIVTLPVAVLDPTYNQFRLHDYETWTPPAGGGTITNVAATGVTVRLGNVAAGTSATFVVQYQRAIDTSAPNVVPASYFPNGYQIQQSATISSPNATGNATDAAAPVTWQTGVPAPSIVKTGPASIRPDTDMTYTLAMSDGCLTNRGSGRWTSNGSVVCAESYTVVDTLPAQAVFVSATDGGVYNSATHTVTWTETGAGAAGGWGVAAVGGWTQWQPWGFNNRAVTVRYPAAAFPESADGADFVVPVTNNINVSVTYLDDATTVKNASTSFTHDVVRVEPFGRSDQSKIGSADQDVQGTRYVNVPPDTTGLVCPSNGRDDWNRPCTAGQPVPQSSTRTDLFWRVDTVNRANVPGVATVVDNDLGNSSVRVRRIITSGGTGTPTIAWTITNGTTVTSGTTTAATYTAPAGSWLTAATVTSGSLAGPNLLPSGTAGTVFRVDFGYDLPVGSALFTWRNNASATMAYPGQPQISPIPVTSTAAVIFREMPKVAAPVVPPTFGAGFAGTPAVEGGGLVVPGGKVTFGVRGSTANIPTDRDVSPQYVFIAPAGWTVQPNSASFPAGSIPVGVSYVYKTVTIAGVSRQAVIASWPTGAVFGSNATWPTMSVVASPTAAVTAGTTSIATVWAGDSRNAYAPDTTTWSGKVVDASDVDGDANVTEAFASATVGVSVSGTQRLDVIKEICVETDGECVWVSNPDIVVGVDPDATNITYRVTIVNAANTVLNNVVGYDVLPHLADGRGSTFAETLNAISSSSSNVTLSYSNSTNPCRVEVLPTNPGCAAGWAASASGAQAIRAQVNGALAPGASASFVFTANVVAGAPADAIACNSVAVDSASTLASEPRAVCATTQQADLAISVPDRLPLQAGRPGTVPFSVTNLGGSQAAPASVEIQIPTGIRITSLAPEGWQCAASETEADGSVLGPVTLNCQAVDASGIARSLALNVPDALALPAVVPDDTLVGEDTCFPATVSGLMSDPDLENNDAAGCFAVVAGDSLLEVTKDDGLTQATIGQEITYTVTVSNLLVGEDLGTTIVTDTLPDTVTFVSASAGGSVSAQGEEDAEGNLPGGTVSWSFDSVAGSGVEGSSGDTATGGTGSTQTVTVTVRVLQAAEGLEQIVNEATATAADPASPEAQLVDTDQDVDAVIRVPGITVVKTADAPTYDAVDDVVTYTFRATNTGNVTLSEVSIIEGAFTGSGPLSDVTCETTTLAPGDFVDCTAAYEVEQGDLDRGTVSNSARVTGLPPAGLSAPMSTPSTVVVSAVQTPALTLVKTATPTSASAAGDEVSYSFVVSNTGNVTLTAVEITETAFTGDPDNLTDVVCPAAAESLAPGDSVTCDAEYEAVQADVDRGSVSNTATATADAPGVATNPVSAPSTADVTFAAAPDLSLNKTVSGSAADSAGDTVTYLFAVRNTGNVTVAAVEIEETAFSGTGEAVSIECPVTSLVPADGMTCVGTYELTQADVDAGGIDNTAVVNGLAPDSTVVSSESSTAELMIDPDSELTLVKSASPISLVVDELVTYSFVVTNTGNVTVSDLQIEETEFTGAGTLSDVACAATTLAPDAQAVCSATYTITQADVDAGTLDNTAVASGLSPSGAVSSEASFVRLPFEQEPALALVKSADVETYSALGDAIRYGFRVTNTGNVSMADVDVIETDFTGSGELAAIECPATTLLPGEFVDCSATYTVTQDDLDAGELGNTARAEGSSPLGEFPTQSSDSSVRVLFAGDVGLRLVKTGTAIDVDSNQVITAGDQIAWSFQVTNSGVATVSALKIDDPTVGSVICDATLLPPGATVNCEAPLYSISQADAALGRVVNVATASAVGPGGVVVESVEASATVQVEAMPLAATGYSSVSSITGALLLVLFGGAALMFARNRRIAGV